MRGTSFDTKKLVIKRSDLLWLLYVNTSPVEYNGANNLLIVGRGKKRKTRKFKNIYALQLLSVVDARDKTTDYEYFQLNIGDTEGERIHLLNYRNLLTARRDSAELCEFVKVKLWDATLSLSSIRDRNT